LKRHAEEVPMTIVAVNGGGNTPNGDSSVPREDTFDFTTEGSAAEGKPFLKFQFDTVFTATKTDYSGGDTWLAEDHGPSDPSDGLKPTESLLPMESITDGTSNTVLADGSVRFVYDGIYIDV
jgi:hypothetical protein